MQSFVNNSLFSCKSDVCMCECAFKFDFSVVVIKKKATQNYGHSPHQLSRAKDVHSQIHTTYSPTKYLFPESNDLQNHCVRCVTRMCDIFAHHFNLPSFPHSALGTIFDVQRALASCM